VGGGACGPEAAFTVPGTLVAVDVVVPPEPRVVDVVVLGARVVDVVVAPGPRVVDVVVVGARVVEVTDRACVVDVTDGARVVDVTTGARVVDVVDVGRTDVLGRAVVGAVGAGLTTGTAVVGGGAGATTVMTFESVPPTPGCVTSIFHCVTVALSTRRQTEPEASVVARYGPTTVPVALSVAYALSVTLLG
jgi:hypothetical protein